MPMPHARSLILAIALALGSASVAGPALAKEAPTQEEMKAMWKAEDWKGLTKALGAMAKANPEDGGVWLQLGLVQLRAGKYDKAVEAFQAAEDHGIPGHLTRYNSACAQALSGDVDAAFASLSGALDAGFRDVKLLSEDADLAALRGDRRLEAALKRADQNARPCELDERFAALDFWVGEWVVTNAGGYKVGTNTIERDLRGCMVLESWNSPYGGAGKSLNVYDPAADVWRQTWVAESGGVTVFEGTVKDGGITFEGEAVALDGTITGARMSLTPNPDGTVTQIGSRSADGGATWQQVWQGTYTRVAPGDGHHAESP